MGTNRSIGTHTATFMVDALCKRGILPLNFQVSEKISSSFRRVYFFLKKHQTAFLAETAQILLD